MIIDCIADLHGHCPELQGGDLLIIAGDLTIEDKLDDWAEFNMWIEFHCVSRYKGIIVIGGNHDNLLYEGFNGQRIDHHLIPKVKYLQDAGHIFAGLKIWGSPWTKRFAGMNQKCMAFTVNTEEELAEKWKLIPDDVDILVTHCPPKGIMDKILVNEKIENVGSLSLLIKKTSMNNLKLWVFGHIHEGAGIKTLGKFFIPTYVNASHVNKNYEPFNKPIRVEL